ncbi:LysR family transcriptional regulator [Sphingobium sp. H33]|uniref:LysR family transcriptional regulator n=1 Tax=Sphingobium nicotianae TaxID=2782607 RepID=A0A9X1DE88_9SPHN|nr:LysR family transcriptional regulator [Sphingobium nicotianae]
MEWDDVRIFLAIARNGTLSAAARTLGQTQPAMGRRLKALETAVGQALFQRTPHGLVPTDEGAAMLAHAERMEHEAIALERSLAGRDGRLEGSLRVTSSEWFGLHVLTPALSRFAERHPDVTVELVTDSRLYSLGRRECDLSFRIARFEEVDVIQRRLLRLEYAVYKRSDATIPSRLITMDAAFSHLPDAMWLRARFPAAPIAFRSNNREVQARACAEGIGLAVLPKRLGDATAGIEQLDVGAAPPGREMWMGYHRDLRRLPRLRALVDFIVEVLG